MLIYEFYGLPGVGKSTFCKAFEKRLAGNGLKVINVQFQPLPYGRVRRNLLKIMVRTDSECRKILSYASKNIPECGNFSKKYWVERIIQTLYLTKAAMKNGYDVVVMDEGYAQFISSLCHGEEVSEPYLDMYKMVMEYAVKLGIYKRVGCNLEYVEVIRRISRRKRAGDRFYSEDGQEMLERLKLKQRNLDKIIGTDTVTDNILVDLSVVDNALMTVMDSVNS